MRILWLGGRRREPFVPGADDLHCGAVFPGGEGVPDLKSVMPRVSAVYDLAGDGRTALKFSANRYRVLTQLNGFIGRIVPIRLTNDTRTWDPTRLVAGPGGSLRPEPPSVLPVEVGAELDRAAAVHLDGIGAGCEMIFTTKDAERAENAELRRLFRKQSRHPARGQCGREGQEQRRS